MLEAPTHDFPTITVILSAQSRFLISLADATQQVQVVFAYIQTGLVGSC